MQSRQAVFRSRAPAVEYLNMLLDGGQLDVSCNGLWWLDKRSFQTDMSLRSTSNPRTKPSHEQDPYAK